MHSSCGRNNRQLNNISLLIGVQLRPCTKIERHFLFNNIMKQNLKDFAMAFLTALGLMIIYLLIENIK